MYFVYLKENNQSTLQDLIEAFRHTIKKNLKYMLQMECQNINKYFPVHLIVVFKLFICIFMLFKI